MAECNDPAVGLLLSQYELHLLDQDAVERFELHLIGCPACTQQLVRSQAAVDLIRLDPAVHETIRSLTHTHTTLGRRIGQAWWPNLPFIARPAVMCGLLVVAAAALFFLDRHQEEKNPLAAAQVKSTPADATQSRSSTLAPVSVIRLTTLRAAASDFVVETGRPLVLEFSSDLALSEPLLSVSLSRPDEQGISEALTVAFDDQLVGRLLLPESLADSGQYLLKITSPATGETETIPFTLRSSGT